MRYEVTGMLFEKKILFSFSGYRPVVNEQFWPAELLAMFKQKPRLILKIIWEDKPADSNVLFAIENCRYDGEIVFENGCSLDVTRFHRVIERSPDRFAEKELEFKIIDKNENDNEAKISCSFLFCVDAAENIEMCNNLLTEC